MDFTRFSLSTYRELIHFVKLRRKIFSYDQCQTVNESYAIIRHDVDFSLQRALKIAEIEHQEGVISAFFVQLNSFFYNLFEDANLAIVNKIVALGHDIGLHLDATDGKISCQNQLEDSLQFNKMILERLCNCRIKTFAFHNASSTTRSRFSLLSYVGLINAYADNLLRDAVYCSDSGGRWGRNNPIDAINSSSVSKVHLLTHPAWWQDEPLSADQCIERCLEGCKQAHLSLYNKSRNSM